MFMGSTVCAGTFLLGRNGIATVVALRIAIAVFEDVEELPDFVGPWEVLTAWRDLGANDVEVVLVGESTAPVTCAKVCESSPRRVGAIWAKSTSSSTPAAAAPVPRSATRRFVPGCAP